MTKIWFWNLPASGGQVRESKSEKGGGEKVSDREIAKIDLEEAARLLEDVAAELRQITKQVGQGVVFGPELAQEVQMYRHKIGTASLLIDRGASFALSAPVKMAGR